MIFTSLTENFNPQRVDDFDDGLEWMEHVYPQDQGYIIKQEVNTPSSLLFFAGAEQFSVSHATNSTFNERWLVWTPDSVDTIKFLETKMAHELKLLYSYLEMVHTLKVHSEFLWAELEKDALTREEFDEYMEYLKKEQPVTTEGSNCVDF